MAPPLLLDAGPELTIVHAAALREHWLDSLKQTPGDVVLSLSQVQEFDSSGVQLLLALARSLQTAGQRLTLEHPSQIVRDVFALFQLEDLQRLVGSPTAP